MKHRAFRVRRGGSYADGARGLRAASRCLIEHQDRSWSRHDGFRIVVIRRKP